MSGLLENKALFDSGRLKKADYIEEMGSIHGLLFDYPDLIRDSIVNRIEITRDGILFTVGAHNLVFKTTPRDRRTVVFDSLNFGNYEPNEMQAFKNFISQTKNFVDIGANIGWYSLLACALNAEVDVLSVEANPYVCSILQENVCQNSLTNRIRVRNIALQADEMRENVDFFFEVNATGNGSMRNVANKREELLRHIRVEAATLDDEIGLAKINPEFLKMDVEGAELLVLQGAEETLKNCEVIMLEGSRKWCAAFGYDVNEIFSYLGDRGFGGYIANKEGGLQAIRCVTDDTTQTNFIFAK